MVSANSSTPLVLKRYNLLYIKRKDAKFHCSFGTGLNNGANFAIPPCLPHRPYGIIVGHDAIIGKDSIIYHQVTIAVGGV